MPYQSLSYEYIADLNASCHQTFFNQIQQSVYEHSWLFSELKERNNVLFQGGTEAQWPVRVEELGLARFISSNTARTTQIVETRHPLVEPYSRIICDIGLT